MYSKYSKNDKGVKEFIGFVVNISISETEEYNTIYSEDLIQGIEQSITNELDRQTTTYIVGYGQPTVEVLLKAYDPLICSLARKQKLYWQQLEYEDLCQSCRMVLIDLYNKGYYIHKTLLEKSFNNYVLMSLRSERNKPNIISLDQQLCINDENVSVSNIVPDEQQDIEREEQEDNEALSQALSELRDYIVNKIGQRQYDQLIFEYNSKTTSNWSRSMLSKLKRLAKNDGVIIKLTERYL